jgi:hypothetical protein
VPVFVSDAGEVLAESADILRWADTQVGPERRLYPDGELGADAAALEAWLDRGFGPDGRLWMYHETLPMVRELQQWALAGVPRWERVLFPADAWSPSAQRLPRESRVLLIVCQGCYQTGEPAHYRYPPNGRYRRLQRLVVLSDPGDPGSASTQR